MESPKEILEEIINRLGLEREYAVDSACALLKRALEEADKLGLQDIHICPETMGKLAQIGTTLEIVDFCKIDKIFLPCIDFGHINAREQGSLKTKEDYLKDFNSLDEDVLKIEALKGKLNTEEGLVEYKRASKAFGLKLSKIFFASFNISKVYFLLFTILKIFRLFQYDLKLFSTISKLS